MPLFVLILRAWRCRVCAFPRSVSRNAVAKKAPNHIVASSRSYPAAWEHTAVYDQPCAVKVRPSEHRNDAPTEALAVLGQRNEASPTTRRRGDELQPSGPQGQVGVQMMRPEQGLEEGKNVLHACMQVIISTAH
jgi:hypothetical protein